MSRCDACQALILASGITRGLVRCMDCNFYCHEKCVPGVPRDCPGRPQPTAHRHLVGSTVATSGLPGTGVVRPWNRQRAKTEDRNLHKPSTKPESLALSNPRFGCVPFSPPCSFSHFATRAILAEETSRILRDFYKYD